MRTYRAARTGLLVLLLAAATTVAAVYGHQLISGWLFTVPTGEFSIHDGDPVQALGLALTWTNYGLFPGIVAVVGALAGVVFQRRAWVLGMISLSPIWFGIAVAVPGGVVATVAYVTMLAFLASAGCAAGSRLARRHARAAAGEGGCSK